MAGSDFNIHDGTPQGVMRELCSAFVREGHRTDVPAMMLRFAIVKKSVPLIMQQAGAKTIYEARVFADLLIAADRLVSVTS